MAIHALTGPGTYTLVIKLDRAQTIMIGRRGRFDFPAGFYVYVGSAFGPGGLAARLRRHQRSEKRLHWHVDYVLGAPATRVLEVWTMAGPVRYECDWARALLALPGAGVPVHGLGASDCRCAAHLLSFGDAPPEAGRAAWAGAPRVTRIRIE